MFSFVWVLSSFAGALSSFADTLVSLAQALSGFGETLFSFAGALSGFKETLFTFIQNQNRPHPYSKGAAPLLFTRFCYTLLLILGSFVDWSESRHAERLLRAKALALRALQINSVE
ncbi:hypothetical protein [Sporosarcina sp. Marseille-Q4943]|uniref:hypothetical protein n=1 Tax=Sporosarcina sp. Marseille-Q4943 TaxID=2942204 RepID=UPI00208DB2FF|nr:hypothetical protein [Sporosarcina sp. Marseille-Q4943]